MAWAQSIRRDLHFVIGVRAPRHVYRNRLRMFAAIAGSEAIHGSRRHGTAMAVEEWTVARRSPVRGPERATTHHTGGAILATDRGQPHMVGGLPMCRRASYLYASRFVVTQRAPVCCRRRLAVAAQTDYVRPAGRVTSCVVRRARHAAPLAARRSDASRTDQWDPCADEPRLPSSLPPTGTC